MENSIIPLKKEYVKTPGEILARALNDDPVSLYIIPNDEERTVYGVWLFLPD